MDRARRGYSLASTTAPSDMQRAACQLSQLTSTQRALLARATRHTAPPHTTAPRRPARVVAPLASSLAPNTSRHSPYRCVHSAWTVW
jgi:hypothetical protein